MIYKDYLEKFNTNDVNANFDRITLSAIESLTKTAVGKAVCDSSNSDKVIGIVKSATIVEQVPGVTIREGDVLVVFGVEFESDPVFAGTQERTFTFLIEDFECIPNEPPTPYLTGVRTIKQARFANFSIGVKTDK